MFHLINGCVILVGRSSATGCKMGEFKDTDGSILVVAERLKFYYIEHQIHAEQYSKKLTQEQCLKIHKKLIRHYDLNVRLEFCRRRGGAFRGFNAIWGRSGIIFMGKEPSFGLLCHEIAHAIDYKKHGHTNHNKRLSRILKSVMAYVKKKNYWEKLPIEI